MNTALWLLASQGMIGAFDTVYYHEWRARLPSLGPQARAELKLHAARDFIYAVLFATLPWFTWQGSWALVLAALLATEIVLTLKDFVVEDWVRKPLGGLYPGERVTHAVMGIIYGAMLAYLLPHLWAWRSAPTGFAPQTASVPNELRWLLLVMAAGVFLSGLRDLAAALGLPHSNWPWGPPKQTASVTRT